MTKIDKLIVTNSAALRRKYNNGARSVDAAIKRLIVADKKRGIVSRRVNLDAVDTALKDPDMASTTRQRLTKETIDKACSKYRPDYLMIIGATDVVVMQELKNPMNSDDDPQNDDDDSVVPSDLPYACEEGYNTEPETFVGPVRVVGRLPDMVGAAKPDYVVDLLTKAAGWKQRPRSDKVLKNSARTAKEVRGRRIFALTGSVGGPFSRGGRVVSIIATTEDGEIVHLRRVRSR